VREGRIETGFKHIDARSFNEVLCQQWEDMKGSLLVSESSFTHLFIQ
jgi:hypothetical protein